MTETRKVNELKNWDKNPRNIKLEDFNRLKKQIKRLGIYKPLLINSDNVVLGGNMRLKAYRDLGIEEVEVNVVDAATEAKMLEYAISDNDRAGYWEEADLTELLNQLQAEINLADYKVDLANATQLTELLEKEIAEIKALEYQSQYQVVVDVENEIEQQEVYEKLIEMGLNCKILTL